MLTTAEMFLSSYGIVPWGLTHPQAIIFFSSCSRRKSPPLQKPTFPSCTSLHAVEMKMRQGHGKRADSRKKSRWQLLKISKLVEQKTTITWLKVTYLSLCPMMPQSVEISGSLIVSHYCASEIVEHSCFGHFQGTMKLTWESQDKRCPYYQAKWISIRNSLFGSAYFRWHLSKWNKNNCI